ncbi:MAG TPA: M15 family metallopeptidase [Polyangiaceae bacterium]
MTTVQDVANAAGCATSAVFGLSKQIVDEVNCLVPNALAPIPSRPNLVQSSTTFAFLQPPARDDLVKALDANTGMTLDVESILRTVAQQYLLYAWYKMGLCGIQLAATPGTSNHEQGLAFDTADHAAWLNMLQSNGFTWYGSADVVHFDYTGGGAVDLNGKDVLAFQKLWNANNPTDLIAEDGSYGTETETRIQKTAADGFATGASCGPTPVDGGTPPPVDGGNDGAAASDASSPPPPGDAGTGDSSSPLPGDDAGAGGGGGGGDASTPNFDQPGAGSGCACRAAPGPSDAGVTLALAAVCALSYARRRGARGLPRRR